MSQEILLADYSKKLDQQYSEAHSQKKANTDFVNDKSGYCNIDYFHDLNLSSLVLFSWVYSILKVITLLYKRKPKKIT